jgi:hypothetical protein
MDLTINFESSVPRQVVALHAWEPQGEVWDVTERTEPGKSFRFRLRGAVQDQRNVAFKFRFPDERRWEPDDYIRRIVTRRAAEFWTFDYSPRVVLRAPAKRTAPTELTVQLLTQSRFAAGQLYAWRPGTDRRVWIKEGSRDAKASVSSFRIRLEPWMSAGFHFKFVDARGGFESDACTRVWLPEDGAVISVKSGQATFWAGPPTAKSVSIQLIYPKSIAAPPELRLEDEAGEVPEQAVSATGTPVPVASDARFLRASYRVAVYPNAPYSVSLRDPGVEGALRRPLRVAPEDEGEALELLAMVGDARWLKTFPARAPISLVFHPRPWTAPITRLHFDVGVGTTPAFERVAARATADGAWRADFSAPIGVALLATPGADRPLDQRKEGPVSTARRFALADATPLEFHTADAQIGFKVRAASSSAAGSEVRS